MNAEFFVHNTYFVKSKIKKGRKLCKKNFHYYGVFYLPLCAGIEPVTAYKIAYSSQYVDDSTESKKKTASKKAAAEK